MFLRPATPSNSLPESPHNSQTRLSPLPEALYDRQCFKRAAASTVGPAPTENFEAAFEAIPATLIVVDAALRTISATSFSIASFREGPALWLCSIAGPTVVPATTQVVLPVLDRGHSWGTELYTHALRSIALRGTKSHRAGNSRKIVAECLLRPAGAIETLPDLF